MLEMFEGITIVSQITESQTEPMGKVLLLNVHVEVFWHFGTDGGPIVSDFIQN